MRPDHIRVGIDVGGTFTDIVVASSCSGEVVQQKILTDYAEGEARILGRIARVLPLASVTSIVHGTTLVTNAVAERRGARTALITTRGFRDILEIARQSRRELYNLREPGRPAPLVPRRLRFEVAERVSASGEIITPLDQAEVHEVARHLRDLGIEAVAVCLLHSYANGAHEQAVRELLEASHPHVSVSSEINSEFREYERTSTVVLNAYVMPLVTGYVEGLEQGLKSRGVVVPLRLVQSNGGMMSTAVARRQPLRMLMSGPAAGVAASRFLVRRLGIPSAVAFDMGGTTTDVCLIAQGTAAVTSERTVGGLPARFPSLAVESIGAGGGSVAWVDEAGALKVGPRSAASCPGPACYGLGGMEATITDANLLLGYLGEETALADGLRLSREASEKVIRHLGERLGLDPLGMADGIVAVGNANMMNALKLVSLRRGYDLRKFVLVAYGGAGPMHAGRLARNLRIPKVVVPAFSSVFSAWGCLVSDVRYDAVQTHHGRLEALDTGRVNRRFLDMEAPLLRRLLDEGYAPERIQVHRAMDLRYVGQNYEIEVSLPGDLSAAGLEALRKEFDAQHHALYSYSTKEAVECVNLRVVVGAPTEVEPVEAAARLGKGALEPKARRQAWFKESGIVEMSVYDRAELRAQHEVRGPAAVEDAWSTVIVYPSQVLRVDRFGNLHIEVEL